MTTPLKRARRRSHTSVLVSYLSATAVMLLIMLTGGTPSVYMNLMYIPLAVISTYGGKWRSLLFAFFWGFIPIPMMLLWGHGMEPLKQIITRPLTFILISLIISTLSDFHWEKLKKEETFDALTGLKKLTALQDSLEKSTRDKNIIFLTMRNLQIITNIFSYTFTDEVIREFSRILQGRVRQYQGTEVYRLVENGFVIELPSSKKDQDERLDALIRDLHELNTTIIDVQDVPVYVELRFGIARQVKDLSPQESIKRASLAHKYAFDHNLVSYTYEEKLQEDFSEQMFILNSFKQALKEKQIRLAYQNIFESDGATLHSREFLARWQKPDGSFISPGIFIPLIEQTDLIHSLTRYVIDEALAYMTQSPQEEKHVISSLNFSSKDFSHSNIEYLIEQVRATGVDPLTIQIEITEETLRNIHSLSSSVKKLREAGIRIVIDDFGTGYSSYELLATLSIDGVKIDRSIISNIDSGYRYRKLCENLVDFCRTFHITTVAEGVETESVADKCREIGIDYLQGFLYSRPKLI